MSVYFILCIEILFSEKKSVGFTRITKGPWHKKRLITTAVNSHSARKVLYNEKSLQSGSVSFNVGLRTDIAMGTEAYVRNLL